MDDTPSDRERDEPLLLGDEPDAGIASLAKQDPAPRALALASGRSIEVEQGEMEVVRIRDRSGDCILAIKLTDEGPVLSLSGAAIEVSAARRLSLACDTLEVETKGDASFAIGGDLTERVRGNVARAAAGTATTQARTAQLLAHPGGVEIRANDDVSIDGERVRLNCEDPPMPLTWEEHRARRALIGDQTAASRLLQRRRTQRGPADS